MKLYNERTTNDFLWITVLYSGKVNGGQRSLNLFTTRTGVPYILNANAQKSQKLTMISNFDSRLCVWLWNISKDSLVNMCCLLSAVSYFCC